MSGGEGVLRISWPADDVETLSGRLLLPSQNGAPLGPAEWWSSQTKMATILVGLVVLGHAQCKFPRPIPAANQRASA